jgi:hypothetical protein
VEGLKRSEYEAWKVDPITKKVVAKLIKVQKVIMEDWANGLYLGSDQDAFARGKMNAMFDFYNLEPDDGG